MIMKVIKALLVFHKLRFSNYPVCQLLHLQTTFCKWGKKSFPAVALAQVCVIKSERNTFGPFQVEQQLLLLFSRILGILRRTCV